MYAAFHKALYRYPSRDIDELDLFCCKFIKAYVCQKIVKIQSGLTKLLQKNGAVF